MLLIVQMRRGTHSSREKRNLVGVVKDRRTVKVNFEGLPWQQCEPCHQKLAGKMKIVLIGCEHLPVAAAIVLGCLKMQCLSDVCISIIMQGKADGFLKQGEDWSGEQHCLQEFLCHSAHILCLCDCQYS